MIVTVDAVVAGLVPKLAVMPTGKLDAASVTAELKPFSGAIVTFDVPAKPATAVADGALSEKLGAAVTVSGIVLLAVSVPLVPFTVSG